MMQGNDPDSASGGNWLSVTRCPGCGSTEFSGKGLLPRDYYNFRGEIIKIPREGIGLAECLNCSLVFKTVLPAPDFLTEVIESKAGTVWNDTYDFKSERELIEGFVGSGSFDLLDIGPSNGALLKAFSGLPGKRSGLDIVQHPGLEKHLRGEFIRGLLDDIQLIWDGTQYDVVTVFDVLEHFYQPGKAFSNLGGLLKEGGIVVLETGDTDCFWSRKLGVEQWRYTNLFEHHVFWRPESIQFHANKNGFDVLSIKKTVHKGWKTRSVFNKIKQLLKLVMWLLVPNLYKRIADRLKEDGSISPQVPYTRDHLLVVLKKR